MPGGRDVLLVGGLLIALVVHFRAERVRLETNPGYEAVVAFLSTDSAAVASLGAPLRSPRLRFISRDGNRHTYGVTFQRFTDRITLRVAVDSTGESWNVREVRVFAPDTSFVLDRGYPSLPDGPLLAPTLVDRARRASRQGDPATALSLLTQALEHDPGDLRALVERGWLHQRQGRWESALQDFEKAYGLDDGDHDALYGYGLELGRDGRYRESIAILDRAVALRPNRPDAYYVRAVSWGRLGDERRQTADLRASCARGGDDACGALDRHGLRR